MLVEQRGDSAGDWLSRGVQENIGYHPETGLTTGMSNGIFSFFICLFTTKAKRFYFRDVIETERYGFHPVTASIFVNLLLMSYKKPRSCR